jgi:hypothetical protein
VCCVKLGPLRIKYIFIVFIDDNREYKSQGQVQGQRARTIKVLRSVSKLVRISPLFKMTDRVSSNIPFVTLAETNEAVCMYPPDTSLTRWLAVSRGVGEV